jgi:hypothetical protein
MSEIRMIGGAALLGLAFLVCQPKAEVVTALPTPEPIAVAESVEPVKRKATIAMFSLEGCQPCELWWATERPKYERQGWDVRRVYGVRKPSYPSFAVDDLKVIHSHNRWLTTGDVRRFLGQPVKATVRKVGAVFRGSDWLIGGRPWSEQSLRNHLYSHSAHRHPAGSLDGLSLDELQALHNADHEGRSVARVASVSSCPGGNCPQVATTRRRLFR